MRELRRSLHEHLLLVIVDWFLLLLVNIVSLKEAKTPEVAWGISKRY